MDPITIAIVCAAVFGVVATLAAFIRQLLLSRDKQLNDLAQQRALTQEVHELEKLRAQMFNSRRFDSHYQVIGANKDAIAYLDQKIEDNLKKKSELIQRYAQVAIKESSAIISGDQLSSRKATCDRLKEEVDKEIQFYDNEIEQLQKRRVTLWDSHLDLQDYLLSQEKKRNKHLDAIYQQHSNTLEKIYLRHNENVEHVTKSTVQAGTSTFKAVMMAPINFLLGVFKLSTGISPDAATKETDSREDVEDVEADINGDEDLDGSDIESKDSETEIETEIMDDTNEKTSDEIRKLSLKIEI